MERQFKATCDRNTQLAQDLGAANKEIEILKGKLKELEVCFTVGGYHGREVPNSPSYLITVLSLIKAPP